MVGALALVPVVSHDPVERVDRPQPAGPPMRLIPLAAVAAPLRLFCHRVLPLSGVHDLHGLRGGSRGCRDPWGRSIAHTVPARRSTAWQPQLPLICPRDCEGTPRPCRAGLTGGQPSRSPSLLPSTEPDGVPDLGHQFPERALRISHSESGVPVNLVECAPVSWPWEVSARACENRRTAWRLISESAVGAATARFDIADRSDQSAAVG